MLILFNLCQQWNNILREYGVTQNQTKKKTLKNSTKIKAAQVICIKAKQNEVKQNTDGSFYSRKRTSTWAGLYKTS